MFKQGDKWLGCVSGHHYLMVKNIAGDKFLICLESALIMDEDAKHFLDQPHFYEKVSDFKIRVNEEK